MVEGLFVPVLVLAFLTIPHVIAQDQCGGPYVELTFSREGYGQDTKPLIHIGSLASFGNQLNETGMPSKSGRVWSADPIDACQPLTKAATGSVVLVSRGECSFVDKALNVQQAGGVAMLMFDNEPGCIQMGANLPNATTPSPTITIPCISITQASGQQLTALVQQTGVPPLTANLEILNESPLDAGSVILLLIAVATTAGGAWLAGWDHMAEKVAAAATRRDRTVQASGSGLPQDSVMDITVSQAGIFLVVASAMLLLLFFFLNKFSFYLLLVLFCFASSNALTVWFLSTLDVLLPHLKDKTLDIPCLGPCPVLGLVAWPVAVGIAALWAVFRHATGAWVVQDLLGVALMLLVLRTLRITNIRVACVLLPACFLYDIFWVFISPFIFGGTSVMVEVAQGGSMHESVPMLLKVPRFEHPELGGYSMLGFGDIILPGLLVAYTRRMDIDLGLSVFHGYYLPCSFSYAAGLATTYVALMFSWFGDQGQPALLYLVPFTLGTVLGLGWMRGHLSMMFSTNKQYKLISDGESDPGSPDVDVEAAVIDSSTVARSGAGNDGGGALLGKPGGEASLTAMTGEWPRNAVTGDGRISAISGADPRPDERTALLRDEAGLGHAGSSQRSRRGASGVKGSVFE